MAAEIFATGAVRGRVVRTRRAPASAIPPARYVEKIAAAVEGKSAVSRCKSGSKSARKTLTDRADGGGAGGAAASVRAAAGGLPLSTTADIEPHHSELLDYHVRSRPNPLCRPHTLHLCLRRS